MLILFLLSFFNLGVRHAGFPRAGQVIRNVNVETKNYKHHLQVSLNSFLQPFIRFK